MLKFVSSLGKILKQSACQKMFFSFCRYVYSEAGVVGRLFFMICLLNGTTVRQAGENMSGIF